MKARLAPWTGFRAMTDASIVQHLADALTGRDGATAAVEIAETPASVTSGSGIQFRSHVIEAIRAKTRERVRALSLD